MLSYVRLDPASGFVLRAYAAPVDATCPLEAISEDYLAAAYVSIAGDTAEVVGLRGRVSRAAYRDFERQLIARGVTRVFWCRHRDDGSIKPVFIQLNKPRHMPQGDPDGPCLP